MQKRVNDLSQLERVVEEVVEIWETRNTLAIISQLNPDINKGNHNH